MKRLKNEFKKNDLYYKLLDRTETVALFETSIFGNTVSGYEVCCIIIAPAEIAFGKEYPEREIIPSNEQFGYDGSKSFFPKNLEEAKMYLQEFTVFLENKKELKTSEFDQ